MTIDHQIAWLSNITNEFHFPDLPSCPGILVTVKNNNNNIDLARRNCIKILANTLGFLNHNYQCWLLGANNRYRKQDRIVLYYKFWKSILQRSLDVDPSTISEQLEIARFSNDKVRFFGAAKCDCSDLTVYQSFIDYDLSAFGISYNKDSAEAALKDWSIIDGQKYPAGLIKATARHQMALACICGAFDDPEADLLITGTNELLQQIYSKLDVSQAGIF